MNKVYVALFIASMIAIFLAVLLNGMPGVVVVIQCSILSYITDMIRRDSG